MSVARNIARNSAVLMIAQLASYVLFFFSVVYTARYLGPAGFGILSFAIGFTALFAFLPDLGLSVLTVRQVARDKSLAPRYLANVGLIKVILAAFAFGLIALVINIGQAVMDYPEQTITVVYLIGGSIVVAGFNQIAYSMFQAHERMEYRGLGEVLNAALMLGGVIAVIKYGFGVTGFASLYLFASAATLVYSVIVLRWRFSRHGLWSNLKAQIDRGFWKPTLRLALPFVLTMLFVSLYYHIDTVMIAGLVSDSDKAVGWYNAAYRIVMMLLSVRMMLGLAIFPVMSQSFITSKESLKLICERYFKYSVMLAVPMGVGIAVLASRFIFVIYGNEYSESAIALQLLVWSVVLMYANFVPQLLQAIDRQLTATKLIMVGAVANVLLNLALIPAFGYVGAAATTIACQALTTSLAFWIFFRTEYRFSGTFGATIVGKVLISSAVMGVLVWYLRDLNLAAIVVIAVAVYGVLVLLMRAFDSTDLHILNGIVKGRAVLPEIDAF